MQEFGAAFINILTPWPLFLTALGTFLGITVGAIPGLTTGMLIILTIPLTYTMDPTNALILLTSMYVGGISGGQISAILLGMPGTPAAVLTTFDGFPMAQKGQPGRALGLGIGASFIGGLVSWIFLALLAKPIADVAVYLGPFDYFSLVLMALVLIASISRGSLIKGLFSAFFGMAIALPGVDPATGSIRLSFGFHQMEDGFKLMPVLIGVFALGQILNEIVDIERRFTLLKMKMKGILMGWQDFKSGWINLLRSSLIGTWVGILPGIGGNIGSIVAYSAAKNFSRVPEKFGEGSEEGIIASECANNATIAGALIPLISMGIPGSIVDIFLMGGMMVHGVEPGPMLSTSHPKIFYGIIVATLLANILMFLMMTGGVAIVAKLTKIPKGYTLPVIMVFCVIGAYGEGNRIFDVWVLLAFGVVGFVMKKAIIPEAPFIIGAVLAPIAELKLRTGLQASGGSYLPLITRPISCIFLIFSLIFLFWPLLSKWFQMKMAATKMSNDR
jgi:putative tricarboxylic transport membrane protein